MMDKDDSISNVAGRKLKCGGRYFSLNFTSPPTCPNPLWPPVYAFGLWEPPKKDPPKAATGALGVVVSVWLLELGS